MKALLLSVALVVFLCSCGSIKPTAPNLPLSAINSTPLPDSKIDLPVSIDLSAVFNDLSSTIPSQLSGEGTVGPAQYRWNVQRQPFTFSLSGDSIHMVNAAHFTGAGYFKNPLNGNWTKVCTCNADATIGIGAHFDILNNYTLSGNTALTQFDLNICNLNVVNVNIAPIIKPRITEMIKQELVILNQKINQFNYRPLLQPTWSALYQPIKIADIGYIVINPSAIRLSGLSGAGSVLSFSAGVTAKPVFYLNNPGKIQDAPLPDLSNAGGNGFNLSMDVHLDYKQLNDLLNNTVANQKIAAGNNAYIIIKNAAIYGSGNNHLLIKVGFTGKQGVVPYHGIVYLTCMPFYDVSTGIFHINDIDFDVNTINKLKEGPAVWILSSALKEYLNSKAHFNVGNQINNLRDKLNQSMNRQVGPHFTLSGKVDSLSLQGILPLKDYILVRVNTAGNMAVKIN